MSEYGPTTERKTGAVVTRTLTAEDAALFADAIKREAHGQPGRPVTYSMGPGVELRCVYTPAHEYGRVMRDEDLDAPSLRYDWSLYVTVWREVGPSHVDEEHRGVRSISEADALRLLAGETPAQMEARQIQAGREVFARIARNHGVKPVGWGGRG